jgi:DNA-binding MarR family transcriptional regulator/GNAT superfamily N-acetyltransferase
MPDACIAAFRRFNRFYTKQIGLLDSGILRSPFSLAEVRVLYEIAHGHDLSAVALAAELRLDAGYLSRILARLQKQGILQRDTSPADGRLSLLALTEKGRRIFKALDRRQEEDVAALLRSVPASGRQRLVESMRAIEQILLTPAEKSNEPLVIRQHRPGDMGWITHRHGVLYSQEYGYDERFEALVAKIVGEFIEHYDPARERCWIAERNGEIAGSIFLVKKSATIAKLRLLYVEPAARGEGIGARLMDECIRFARHARYRKITLWTQSELAAARHLYQKKGFELVGERRHRSFSRDALVAETWELRL